MMAKHQTLLIALLDDVFSLTSYSFGRHFPELIQKIYVNLIENETILNHTVWSRDGLVFRNGLCC